MRKVSRILIVDEEKLSRWVIRRRLESAGYQVEEAASCEKAAELLENRPPQLIVLDHTIERGLHFLSKLNSSVSRIPVILVSANDEAPEVFQNSIFDFQQKPIQAERFLNSVHHALELCKLERKVADYERKMNPDGH